MADRKVKRLSVGPPKSHPFEHQYPSDYGGCGGGAGNNYPRERRQSGYTCPSGRRDAVSGCGGGGGGGGLVSHRTGESRSVRSSSSSSAANYRGGDPNDRNRTRTESPSPVRGHKHAGDMERRRSGGPALSKCQELDFVDSDCRGKRRWRPGAEKLNKDIFTKCVGIVARHNGEMAASILWDQNGPRNFDELERLLERAVIKIQVSEGAALGQVAQECQRLSDGIGSRGRPVFKFGSVSRKSSSTAVEEDQGYCSGTVRSVRGDRGSTRRKSVVTSDDRRDANAGGRRPRGPSMRRDSSYD